MMQCAFRPARKTALHRRETTFTLDELASGRRRSERRISDGWRKFDRRISERQVEGL
jgi:hypothetical protein